MKVPYFIGNFSSKGLDAFKDVIAKTNQLIMLDSSTDPDEEDVSFLYVKTSRVCGYLPKFRFPKMLDSERAQKSKVKFEVVKGERLDFFMLDANTPLTMDEVQVSEFTLVFTRNQRGIVALASVVPGHLDRHQHHILSAGEYTLEELSQQELSGLVFNVFTDH